jgi:hypothetical protein
MKSLKGLRGDPKHQELVQAIKMPKNLPFTFEDMVKGIVHNIRVNEVRSKMTLKTMETPERYDLLTDIYELHKNYHELSFQKYDKIIHLWKTTSPKSPREQPQPEKRLYTEPNSSHKEITVHKSIDQLDQQNNDIPSIYFGNVPKKKITIIDVLTVLK